MSSRSFTDCLTENLAILRSSLPPGVTAQDWYDRGCPDDLFAQVGANVGGLFAAGYLQGSADTLDLTIGDMLEGHGLSFDVPAPSKRQRIRRVR